MDCSRVGRDARLLLADGGAIPNIFGIGLGADYRPWGHMGGEPSFEGQTNGLWLYQNYIGAVVHQGVRECLDDAERLRISPQPEPISEPLVAPRLSAVLEDALMLRVAPAEVPASGG